MTVHQIVFRLNDQIPHERVVLEQLEQYPYENYHQTCKAIVSIFALQGLDHPGSNPTVGQQYYPSVHTQPTMGYSVSPSEIPQQPQQYVETDIQASGGIEPIAFDFGVC